MNTFSNMEINDLLDNRFRLENQHTPNYLAECFQRLFPTLGRMGLSTVIDEIARANHRAFNSSRLPVRGETLDLNFFFELWKRNFRFEGSYSDKFTFGDELRLAFKINSREFWEVLIRADRDLGNYLKDSIELLKYRDLPKEISLNLRLNGFSPDDKTIRLLKEKLPFSRDNFTTHEIAKICLQLFEAANPADYDVRRLAEELEKENGIRRLSGEFTAIIPKKALDRLSTRCVLEFFKSKPLASNEASAMERGVYTLTEADLVLINNQGSEAFWQSIIPDKSIRERTLNMWKLAGMDSDARRFAKGKQILIATERALSDALHKHSAEMRDVYPLCQRAGVSSGDADKFMAMLYLCHDFYKGLANVYINTAMLARFGTPAARRLWDTIKSEGLKKDGVGKIQSRLETETERLNREVKEAIAKGTAKVTEIDLKQIDFTKYEPSKIDFDLRKIGLSQMVLMARSDYRGHGDPVEPAYPPLEHRQDGGTMKASANAITEIKRSEFFVPYFYDDRDSSNPRKRVYKKNKHLVKGTLTIGYGTTKITPEREKAFDHGVTETQAEAWVIEDIENIFLADLQRYTKGLFLNQNQFDALMSVMYNMGATKFYKNSGIMEAIRTKDHKKIANAIENSCLAVPKHFQNGIKDRRLRERSLYERIP